MRTSMCFLLRNLVALSLILSMSSCKTSGDIATGKEYVDPTEVQTVENGVLDDKRPKDPAELNKELDMTQGELETVKMNTQAEQERLKARIAELEKQNQQMNEALTKTPPPPAPLVAGAGSSAANDEGKKTGAAALFEAASADVKEGKFQQAISSLDEIVKSYPKDKLAFAALANLALCQFKTQNFNEAAVTFNQMIDKFPKRKELALAWFGQASSFAQLKQQDDAKLIFEEVVTRYPKSNEASLAKKIILKKEKVPADLFPLGAHYPSLSIL